ncbi:cobalt-factor II C(20)-methyltransferase [Halegenticoccus soli]|uniref:cobalt-factor II C(20)-methyltransferase n=1 Tax=Halegenticoccus soli TaxID=1985678 RepID=UPI000C6E5763
MTLYGVGLGPGDPDLVTVRGERALRNADVVYSPGRLSRSVALEHVPEERIGDLDFPMTRDEEELRRAWKEAAEVVAPAAREGDAAFVTLGDPNVYSTFGHLRRTLSAFHPDVDVEVVPGVSAMTAFATALGVEIEAGAGLSLREAAGGESPVGPDRMILFKVTDAPATHEGLVEAGYDVRYGRRLFMEQGETVVTDDPDDIADRDYYTLAYAERRDLRIESATAAFDAEPTESSEEAEETEEIGDTEAAPSAESRADGGEETGRRERADEAADRGRTNRTGDPERADRTIELERAEGCESGDCGGHR